MSGRIVVKKLCRPCGEALAKKYRQAVRRALGVDVKITCAACGRRRYGFEFTFKE